MDQGIPLSAYRAERSHAPRWMARLLAWRGWAWEALLPGCILALIAGALRLALILRYPLLYDGDALGRWLGRAHPFDSPWVPLFQVCIYVLTRLADSILAVRLLSAFFGATATLAFWRLLRRAFGPAVAYLGGLLLALDPLFILFSIVPYQEGLFLTLACLALWLALTPGAPHWVWLALLVGLAALTRYEGWLLALLIWLLLIWRARRARTLRWRFAAASALALAWAPLLWIAVQRNVSPTGVETLDPTLDLASLSTTLEAMWPTWQVNLGILGGALALGGLLWLGRQAWRGSELAWLLLAFLAGDLLILAFLRPFSPGNLRLPLLLLPIVLTGMAGLLVDGARLAGTIRPKGGQRSPRNLPARVKTRRGAPRYGPSACSAAVPGGASLASTEAGATRAADHPAGYGRKQRLLLYAGLAAVTALALLWYVPIAVQRVAAYDALVQPAASAADDLPRSLPRNASIALLGVGIDVTAFPVYAEQEGWHGAFIDLDPTAASTPAALAAALRDAHADALVIYDPTATSAGVGALVRAGLLRPAKNGPGYAIWLVQVQQPS